MLNLSEFSKKRICVAVSGGVDSVALLHYLRDREAQYDYRLFAVHLEHGIRGEASRADMRFVQSLCEKWKIPLFTFAENCPLRAEREKNSLETAARNFRYEKFAELIKEDKVDYIALAHHQNDEAETVLFRIARGAALSGAKGMGEQNGYLLRPFLSWKKSEIVEYAKVHRLDYCVDETNFELCATRNKLRLNVLPKLEDAVPNAIENIARFATLAAEDDRYLYAESERLINKDEKGRWLVAFCTIKPLFRRACLTVMKTLGVARDYTAAHLESAFALQDLERGAYLCFPQGVIAKKTANGILFYLQTDEEVFIGEKPSEKPFSINGFDGGMYEVNVYSAMPDNAQGEWRILQLDADKLPQSAVFRFRREGDKIEKFGGGTKSLKKFFNEKKIPVEEREWLPLIAEKNDEVVYAVCGVEIADGVKVTETTERVVYVAVKRK